MFADKTLLITGGTGSFGNVVLDRFLKTDIKEIRIFSRDEFEYYSAAEPPVRYGESHLSGPTEPPIDSYSA
nr:polysaccharide biosynthesis protein [Lachnoclostridium phocaeense]